MALFISNTDGKPSASLTMAFSAFLIVTLWLIFWVVGKTFGLNVPAFDETVALAYLTPLLGLYFGRRASDSGDSKKKSDGANAPEGGDPVEPDASEGETADDASLTDNSGSVEEAPAATHDDAGVSTHEPAHALQEQEATPVEAPAKKKRVKKNEQQG